MIATLAVLQLLLLDAPVAEGPARRFALVAGANDGGKGRVVLRYAGSDARAMSTVLTQLGGVAPADLVALDEPSPGELRGALDALKQRLAAARATSGRLEVVFYYSGHSDERGLLLREDRLGYDELRHRLEELPAEVRIGIVDSCASGALTLSKGGVSRPPFLADASNQLKGHAFLTSASVDEAAQESERLKASVFTHALVSGLRGAADASHDGRVTLAEAYQFAFNTTLASTASTRAGPQRPAFDMQLVGTGEVVLTDVRAATSQLELDAKVAGRVFVMNAGSGSLVVEVTKAAGTPMQLGVEPGAYRVLVDQGRGRLVQAEVSLAEHQSRRLEDQQFSTITPEVLVSRGGTLVEEDRPFLPLDVALVYPVSMGGFSPRPPRTPFSLGVLAAREGEVDGVAISGVGTWVDGPMRGLALTGVALKSGGLQGVGVSGATIVTVGALDGLAMSPTTVTSGPMRGLALAAVNVVASRAMGGQLGAVNITTGPMTGAQLGATNLTSGNFGGVQAGALNITGGTFGGLQVGALNFAGAGEVTGAQLSVLNIAGDVEGAQVGVLNIAGKVRGAQVGVLNIARESDASVGVLSVVTHNGFRAALWGNETSVVNLAAKFGGRTVYGYGVAGLNPRGAHYSLGLGVGVKVDFGRWYGMFEVDAETLQRFSKGWGEAMSNAARLVVGYHLTDLVSVFAGPSATQVVSFDKSDVTSVTPWGFDLGAGHRLVPGLTIGVQLL